MRTESHACVPYCYSREVRASTSDGTVFWVSVARHRQTSMHVEFLEHRAHGRRSCSEPLGEGHRRTRQLSSARPAAESDDASARLEVLKFPKGAELNVRDCHQRQVSIARERSADWTVSARLKTNTVGLGCVHNSIRYNHGHERTQRLE